MNDCPLCGAPDCMDEADLQETRRRFRSALIFGFRNGLVTPDDILQVLTELVGDNG